MHAWSLMGYIHEIFRVYHSNIISQRQLRVMLFIKTRFVGGHTFRLLIFVNLFQCQRMLICGVHSFGDYGNVVKNFEHAFLSTQSVSNIELIQYVKIITPFDL